MSKKIINYVALKENNLVTYNYCQDIPDPPNPHPTLQLESIPDDISNHAENTKYTADDTINTYSIEK